MLVLVKWVVAFLLLFGCSSTPPLQSHGRLHAQARTPPPTLGVEDEYKGEVKTAKLRVYADDEHRAENPKWQEAFSSLLHHANEILAAQFGVKFVAEYKTWNYRRPAGEPFEILLVALAAQDPGDDVFAVVALTSAQTVVSTIFDHIGLASSPGKHIVLRGYSDRSEQAAIDKALAEQAKTPSKPKAASKPSRARATGPTRGARPARPVRPAQTSEPSKGLDAKQRASLYQSRRRHKVVSLFLHELAHTLGAHHRGEPNSMMSAEYSPRVSGFDDASRDVIQRMLDARLGRATNPQPVPVQATAHPTLVIVVDQSGNRSIGGNTVDDATLDGLLKLHFTDDKDTEVLIKTRHKAPQNVVLAIVQHAKAAGLQKISISRE